MVLLISYICGIVLVELKLLYENLNDNMYVIFLLNFLIVVGAFFV